MASKSNQRVKPALCAPWQQEEEEPKGVHLANFPSDSHQELTIPLCCVGKARGTVSLSLRLGPTLSSNLGAGEHRFLESPLEINTEWKGLDTSLSESVLQRIEIPSHDLCFSRNISHPLLSSSPQIIWSLWPATSLFPSLLLLIKYLLIFSWVLF